MRKKRETAGCEYCSNYSYDEDYECYTCEVSLDEDEVVRLMTDQHFQCPYFR